MKRIFYLLLAFITLNIAPAYSAILVFSPNGTYTTKVDLATAATASDTLGKKIVITSPVILSTAVNISGRQFDCTGDGSVSYTGSGALTFGTGAVESVPLRCFGGKGDGTTNNSVALDNAVKAASGIPITFGPGTFLFTSPSQLNSQTDATSRPGTRLHGAGVGKTIILNRSNDYVFKHTATPAQFTAQAKANNGEIAYMTITGDGSSPTGAAGIKLESALHFNLHDLAISNLNGNAIATPVNSTLDPGNGHNDYYVVSFLRMVNVTAGSNAGWGFYNDSTANSADIIGGEYSNNLLGGIYLGGTGNSVVSSTVNGNGGGTGGVGGLIVPYVGTTPSNNWIERVEIDNNYVEQVKIEGYHNTLMKCRLVQDATANVFRSATGINIDGTSSGYPQENRIIETTFKFNTPGTASFAAIQIVDAANGVGNVVENTTFASTWAQLVPYSFLGSSRAGNYAIEHGKVIAQVVQAPTRTSVVASALPATTTSLQTTATKIDISTAYYDPSGALDTANKRFIAPYAGIVRVTVNLDYQPVTTANLAATMQIYNNGASVYTENMPRGFSTVGAAESRTFTAEIKVVKGDYLELFGTVATNSTLNVNSSNTHTVTFEML